MRHRTATGQRREESGSSIADAYPNAMAELWARRLRPMGVAGR